MTYKTMRLTLAVVAGVWAGAAVAGEPMIVYRSPQCGCCGGWVDYMKAKGYDAREVMLDDPSVAKQRLKVPETLESCHTAVVDGYVIEGHVPAEAVAKLLAERPKVTGLSAPGMPQGSPGMSGEAQPFTVYAFGPQGIKPFMRVNGGGQP